MPLDYVAERDMLISSPSLSSSHGGGSLLSAPSSSRTRLLLLFPFNLGGQLKVLLTSDLLSRVPNSFPALPLIPIINSQWLGSLARKRVTRRK